MSEFQEPDFPPPAPANLTDRPSRLVSIQSKMRVTAIVLAIASGLEILALGNRYNIVTGIIDGTFSGTTEDATSSDNLVAGASAMAAIATVTLAIMLMIWMYRTTRFLNDRHVSTAKSPKWAVGSWFVPLANFFLVYGTLKDLIVGLGRIFPTVTYSRYSPLRVYWVLMVLGSLAGRASSSAYNDFESLSSYKTSEGLGIVASAIVLVAALFAVRAFSRLKEDVSSY